MARWPFGKNADLRLWARLKAQPWRCANCAQPHDGLFDLGRASPDAWPDGEAASQPNAVALESAHYLTEDLCVVNAEHFFVRCVLELPIVGVNERFGYGVWSSLSRQHFETYVRYFDEGSPSGLGPWFGWFSNDLKGYPDTFGLKCSVLPRAGRQRPLIELHPANHALVIEQRDGISVRRLLEIYELNGHPVRL